MSDRVNHLAPWRVSRVLGVVALLAGAAAPARAGDPPGTPTGSTVEIIFLDAAGKPVTGGERPAPAAESARTTPPRPTPSTAPSTTPPSATPPPTARHPAASVPRAAPPHTPTASSWGATRRHPILGDGSNATELVAAAQRVVGLRGRADRPLVAHVFASAGVPLALAADAVGNDATLAALVAAGRQVTGAGPGDLAFGDVVFFTRPPDVTVRFGVVEAVDPEGRVHVIGESGDVVSRFVLERQHAVRAVARP